MQVGMDPRTIRSLLLQCAVWGAMTDPREDDVPPEFIFNSDLSPVFCSRMALKKLTWQKEALRS